MPFLTVYGRLRGSRTTLFSYHASCFQKWSLEMGGSHIPRTLTAVAVPCRVMPCNIDQQPNSQLYILRRHCCSFLRPNFFRGDRDSCRAAPQASREALQGPLTFLCDVQVRGAFQNAAASGTMQPQNTHVWLGNLRCDIDRDMLLASLKFTFTNIVGLHGPCFNVSLDHTQKQPCIYSCSSP